MTNLKSDPIVPEDLLLNISKYSVFNMHDLNLTVDSLSEKVVGLELM